MSGMYEIQMEQTTPVNFLAGDFPLVTQALAVKEGAVVRKYAPVVRTAAGASEATAGELADLYGIAADDASGGQVVCYLTGQFFAAALTLTEGVALDALEPALRKLGIFLQ